MGLHGTGATRGNGGCTGSGDCTGTRGGLCRECTRFGGCRGLGFAKGSKIARGWGLLKMEGCKVWVGGYKCFVDLQGVRAGIWKRPGVGCVGWGTARGWAQGSSGAVGTVKEPGLGLAGGGAGWGCLQGAGGQQGAGVVVVLLPKGLRAGVATGTATRAATNPTSGAPISTPWSVHPSLPGLRVPPTLLGLGGAP